MFVDDDIFCRAPVDLVYGRLTHLAAYDEWWPGVRTLALPGAGDERFAVELRPGRARRRLRLAAQPTAWRHHGGFGVNLSGDLEGRVEWWLEPAPGGTVVHHLLHAEAARKERRTRDAYRAVLRRGLWALKDHVQSDHRRRVGLVP